MSSYRKARVRKYSNRQTHGFCGTRFYTLWKAMKRRCSPINKDDFADYYARGIRVYDRWIKFEKFKDDMYRDYLDHVKKYGEDNTTLDRIDVDGNYEPSNCRWATIAEQNLNTRISARTTDFVGHRYWKLRITCYLNQCLFYKKRGLQAQILFGCSKEFLKTYLESQFQPGMTWENHGTYTSTNSVWNIDHIIPCNRFDLSKEEDRRRCFHYTNLRPMWCVVNVARAKLSKILS